VFFIIVYCVVCCVAFHYVLCCLLCCVCLLCFSFVLCCALHFALCYVVCCICVVALYCVCAFIQTQCITTDAIHRARQLHYRQTQYTSQYFIIHRHNEQMYEHNTQTKILNVQRCMYNATRQTILIQNMQYIETMCSTNMTQTQWTHHTTWCTNTITQCTDTIWCEALSVTAQNRFSKIPKVRVPLSM